MESLPATKEVAEASRLLTKPRDRTEAVKEILPILFGLASDLFMLLRKKSRHTSTSLESRSEGDTMYAALIAGFAICVIAGGLALFFGISNSRL